MFHLQSGQQSSLDLLQVYESSSHHALQSNIKPLNTGTPSIETLACYHLCLANFKVWYMEAYSEPCETSRMGFFETVVKVFLPLTVFAKFFRILFSAGSVGSEKKTLKSLSIHIVWYMSSSSYNTTPWLA